MYVPILLIQILSGRDDHIILQALGYLFEIGILKKFSEDTDDDILGIGIWDDVSGAIGILDISVGCIRSKAFTALGFALKGGSDLMTGSLGVPFVEDVNDAKLLLILAVKAIVVIVDSDKANVIFGECQLDIPSGFNIISTETGQVLDDNGSDFSVFHISHHTFKAGTIEIRTAEAIVNIEFRIAETFALGVFREDLSLRRDLSRGFSAKSYEL